MFCFWLRAFAPQFGKSGDFMPVFFAVIGTPLYDFAAGCVLAANVYLLVRGGKNYLKGRKK